MKRRTPPSHLTNGFHQAGRSWYLHGDQAPDRAVRLYDKHQLITDLWAEGAIDPDDVLDLVELAEWDDRNAAPGCTGHHRRTDNHATPELKIPVEGLRAEAVEFITDWGFESEAERTFAGAEFPSRWRRRELVGRVKKNGKGHEVAEAKGK